MKFFAGLNVDSDFIQNVTCAAVVLKVQYLLYKEKDPWHSDLEANWLQKVFCNSVTSFAKFWHDYEVHGLEQLQGSEGNNLLVGYHSRCTLDLFYMFCTLRCNVLASYLFYKVEITRPLLPLLNIIPSKSLNGGSIADSFTEALVRTPQPLMLLPGGVFECLKYSSDKHKVQWKEEPGFARVIKDNAEQLGRKTKVFAFYTRNCERILFSPNWWYDLSARWSMSMYDSFKNGSLLVMPPMLVVMLASTGFLPLPSPVKVDTYISEPLTMQPNETAEEFAGRVRIRLQKLIDDVESSLPNDRRTLLHKLAMMPYGVYVLVQNTFLYTCAFGLIMSTYPPLVLYSLYSWLVGEKKKAK
ncbi:hypothetical protein EON65_47355 [archaeon]|nr:MAG: hypothetical protein EON65_47355 [archaeon]